MRFCVSPSESNIEVNRRAEGLDERKIKSVTIALFIAWLFAIGVLAALAEGMIPNTIRQFLLVALIIGPLLLFGEVIAEILVQVLCYWIARIIFPVFTLGWLRVEKFDESYAFPWYRISRDGSGKPVVEAEAASVAVAIAFILGFVAVYVYQALA